jgi:ribosomal protein L32
LAYENCPKCGTRKHQLMACPNCGFSRRKEAGEAGYSGAEALSRGLEKCPECGAIKHRLTPCPKCGFTRTPRVAS